MDTNTKEFGWKLAKISKHGYTNFEEKQDCTAAIMLLKDNNIILKQKEYFRDADTKDFIIQPNKSNSKKIEKFVKAKYGIAPY